MMLLFVYVLCMFYVCPHAAPTRPITHKHARCFHACPDVGCTRAQAHEELSDKAKRRRYDMLLDAEHPPPTKTRFASTNPYTRCVGCIALTPRLHLAQGGAYALPPPHTLTKCA